MDESWSLNCPLPLRDYPRIVLGHGGGGRLSAELVEHMFLPALRAVRRSPTLLNAENLVAFGFVFWLLLDLIQGAYDLSGAAAWAIRDAFIAIGISAAANRGSSSSSVSRWSTSRIVHGRAPERTRSIDG